VRRSAFSDRWEEAGASRLVDWDPIYDLSGNYGKYRTIFFLERLAETFGYWLTAN
jgi:hypothetical protein